MSLSSLLTAHFFSISVSLFLFCLWIHLYYFLDFTYKWYSVILVFLCLTSLGMVFSVSIHVAVNGNNSFFSMAFFIYNITLYICIDTFEFWCWRRLLRVPWIAWRSNQSILNDINPEYSLEGLMQKLKLQYFGHLIQRVNSLERTLMLRKIEGKIKGQQRIRWLDSITDSVDMNLTKLWKIM